MFEIGQSTCNEMYPITTFHGLIFEPFLIRMFANDFMYIYLNV